MIHRPADARLLVNLLSQEKEYAKSLASLLDTSQVSLASFAAYASATPPPTSQHIAAVAESLATADDALRTYATSVDGWREGLQMLKEVEEEVGNVMRDREILVTRLIKASKQQKPSRDSSNPTPSPSSSYLSASSSSLRLASPKSKLTHAQTELQACEAHLAAKETELQQLRMAVVTGRLRERCRALAECGLVWSEVGKAAISALEGSGSFQMLNGMSHPYGYQFQQKPLPYPDHDLPDRPSSDISSSLAPSQSASQFAPTPPRSSSSADSHDNLKSYRLSIPPAHSVGDHLFPPSVSGAHRVSTVNEEDESTPVLRNGNGVANGDADEGGSSDEESQADERQLEVHENTPFGLNPNPKGRKKLKMPLPFHSSQHSPATNSNNGMPASTSAPNPVDSQHTLRLSSHQQQESDSSPTRKRTKSNVLSLRSFTGLFRKSSSTSDIASGSGSPTKSRSSGWMTRTDKNIRDVARGKDDSDDEATINAYGGGGRETSINYAALRKKSAIESKGLPSNPLSDSDSSPSRGKKKLRKASIRGSSLPPESPSSSPRSTPKKKREASPSKTGSTPSSGLSRNGTIQSIKSSSGTGGKITRQRSKSLHIEPSTLSSLSSGNETSTLSRSTSTKSNSTAKGKAKAGESDANESPNVKRRPSAKKRPESWSQASPGTSSVLRTQSPSLSVSSSRTHVPAQSLMSIVEGVAAQNRAAWGQADPNKGLVDIKAPRPLSGADLDTMPYGSAGMVVGTRKEKKSSSRPNSFAASAPSLVTVPTANSVPASPAASSSTLRAPSPVVGGRGNSVPLKSALRNRTPSPNPAVMNNVTSGSSPVNSSLSGSGSASSGSGNSPTSNKLTLSTSNLKPGVAMNGDDDTVSINSSINDVFEDANEEIPPTPPPHDTVDPLATPTPNTNNAMFTSNLDHHLSRTLEQSHDPADNETDISFSSTSTTTPAGHPPVRRKSVRMSSQLMFSSTPPAIEYYEDTPWSHEDGAEGDRNRKRHSKSHSVPNGDASGPGAVGWKSRLDERGAVGHWDDSGSDDEEYSRARQLLSKASRGLDKITGKGH